MNSIRIILYCSLFVMPISSIHNYSVPEGVKKKLLNAPQWTKANKLLRHLLEERYCRIAKPKINQSEPMHVYAHIQLHELVSLDIKTQLVSNITRVEKLRRNRSKNCRFWSTFVDFVGFLCRKCRLSTFSSVLSVFDVRSVD